MNQNLRSIIAFVISLLILVLWNKFYSEPKQQREKIEQQDLKPHILSKDTIEITSDPIETSTDVIDKKRIPAFIENAKIVGSVNLVGARIDDIVLKQYKNSIDKDSDNVRLLSSAKSKNSYFAEFGWISSDKNIELPTSTTVWNIENSSLNKLSLIWKNKQNIIFRINIVLDDDYMFLISQNISGISNKDSISSYALINKAITNQTDSNVMLHEGPLYVSDGKLNEVSYKDFLSSTENISVNLKSGWLGISDKYWLTSIIPMSKTTQKSNLRKVSIDGKAKIQLDVVDGCNFNASESMCRNEYMFFAGSKNLNLLDNYSDKYKIQLFDRAVDLGFLYFITKPIFKLLNYFYGMLGNFGLAILLLTVVIKMLLFPLAYKGVVSMNKLKVLQPEITSLKSKFEGEPVLFQQNLMALYKAKKVNPFSGCLPLLLQMPIFFALYKVLYVTIEMRHAPFYLWIHDLSSPDPMTIMNLFGMIPWNPPTFLMIGVLPILMSLTMYIQQNLNPAPPDPVQAKFFKLMPFIFLFLFSSFPSGLVLYWVWSNILSILQQLVIKKIVR